MDDDAMGFFVFLGMIATVVVAMIIYSWGSSCGKEQMEKEAVVVGLAYYTNNSNGESIWKWKTNSINTNLVLNVTNVTNEPQVKLEKDEGVK